MTADATFWNRIAEKYSRQPVEDPAAFERKIAITKQRMRPDHVVLDVGCGTGSLALRLAANAAEIHGLDVSSEMIRIARDKAARANAENVFFHVGPFDNAFDAFAPGALDGVCAYSILHLVEDRQAALERIYRLLKPGGFFVSSTTCLGESRAPYRPLLAVMRALGKAPWVSILTKAQLASELQRAGFVDVTQPDVGAKATIAFMVAHKPL
jgi:arsenite methyltransferase